MWEVSFSGENHVELNDLMGFTHLDCSLDDDETFNIILQKIKNDYINFFFRNDNTTLSQNQEKRLSEIIQTCLQIKVFKVFQSSSEKVFQIPDFAQKSVQQIKYCIGH